MDKILTKFLTLQHSSKPSDQPTPKGLSEKAPKRPPTFPLHTTLSRSCNSHLVIASLQPVKWSPLTLLIYEPVKDIHHLFDQGKQILAAEESVSLSATGIAEITQVEMQGTVVTGEIAGTGVEFHVATVKTLTSVSGSIALAGLVEAVEGLYGVQPVVQGKALYVLETMSVFQAVGVKDEEKYVRRLTMAELEELCRFYIMKVHVQHIPRDLFPDSSSSSESSLKYSYIIIRDLITLRSGNFCRNWLLQLKPAPPRPASVGPVQGPRLCKWLGCLAPSLEETDQILIQEDMEKLLKGTGNVSDTRKTRKKRKSHSNDPSFTKKPLAPIRKSKNSMLEPSTSGFLCDFHYRLRHFMKTNSMLLSPYLEDSSMEVWKAVQAGLRWQSELSSKVRLGPICSGSAKQGITAYYQHASQCLSVSGRERRFAPRYNRHFDDFFEQQREKLTDVVSELRTKRDTEVAFTNELRDLMVSSQGSGTLSALSAMLVEAAGASVTVKLAKLRAIRDKVKDVGSGGFFTDVMEGRGSARPQSQNMQSERGKDTSPEHQRTKLDEVLHRKIYTSPYGERIYKPGRLARPKLPPKAPSKPLDSQQSSRKKISLINMD